MQQFCQETHNKVSVTTTGNKEVKIKTDGIVYEVPAIIEVRRDDSPKILNAKTEGCDDATLSSSINPVFYGNVLIGGFLGSTTDAATSKSMWKYDDNVVINCS